MSVKLRSVVFFLKLISSLHLPRPFGKICSTCHILSPLCPPWIATSTSSKQNGLMSGTMAVHESYQSFTPSAILFPSVCCPFILVTGATVVIFVYGQNGEYLANSWSSYSAHCRVPTNFILCIFALMLVLLSCCRLDPRSRSHIRENSFWL